MPWTRALQTYRCRCAASQYTGNPLSDISGSAQDLLNDMWNEYVLKDAGGPLPRYDMADPPGL